MSALTLAGIGGLLVLGALLPTRLVRDAEEAWAREVEPMDSFAARYPPQADSPAATALDELTRPLGIVLVEDQDETAPDPELNAELLATLSTAIRELGPSEDMVPPSLPPDALSFLDREGDRIDAIIGQIRRGGSFSWEQDIGKGMSAPIPPLLGHRRLHALLLSRALVAERAGRHAEADDALEASWLLSASLFERADLISQLIAVAVGDMQHAVLRSVSRPQPAWLPRLRSRSFAGGFARALQCEAWSWTLVGRNPGQVFESLPPPESRQRPDAQRRTSRHVSKRIARLVTAPYVRLCVADTSDALLRARRELLSQRRCDLDIDAYQKRFEDSLGRWNIVGRVGAPSTTRAWVSMRRADLGRELTEQVLSARADRTRSGHWPAGDVASAVCEGISWERRTAADGTLVIRASAKPFTNDDPKWVWAVRLHP